MKSEVSDEKASPTLFIKEKIIDDSPSAISNPFSKKYEISHTKNPLFLNLFGKSTTPSYPTIEENKSPNTNNTRLKILNDSDKIIRKID